MKLINGECLEEMDKLIEQWVKVDAIITDPPYWTMEKLNYKEQVQVHWLDWMKWDIAIEPKQIFERANKLLRKNWKLILFSQEPYTSKLTTEAIPNIPFSYRMTWVKDIYWHALLAKKAPLNFTEDILVFSKNHDTDWIHPLREYFKEVMGFIGWTKKSIIDKIGQKADHTFRVTSTQYWLCTEKTYLELIEVFWIDKMEWFKSFEVLQEVDIKFKEEYCSVFNLPKGKKYKSNILEYKKDYTWHHPTQKPLALMEDLIYTYTNEWETVLDFTMGSWSTWVWAKNTNRDFIGIELDEDYFNIAKERIWNVKTVK